MITVLIQKVALEDPAAPDVLTLIVRGTLRTGEGWAGLACEGSVGLGLSARNSQSCRFPRHSPEVNGNKDALLAQTLARLLPQGLWIEAIKI